MGDLEAVEGVKSFVTPVKRNFKLLLQETGEQRSKESKNGRV
jgi:hypothetical protein